MAADPFSNLGFAEEKPTAAPAADFGQLGFTPTETAPLRPMQAFEKRAKAFDDLIERYVQEQNIIPRASDPAARRQEIRRLTAERFSTPDPEPERGMAEIEEVAQGGELQYGTSPGYAISKTLASIGGFAGGGPVGATLAEGGVRYIALAEGLKKAMDAGAITEERAARIMIDEMSAGGAEDLAWNTAVPLLGNILKRVPGVRGLIAKVVNKIKPGVAPDADLAAQRAGKVAARVKDMPTPAGKQAVEELSGRMGSQVLTPGNVTGQASILERTARVAGAGKFAEQELAMQKAAEGVREATLMPAGQPTREAIGTTITDLAETAQAEMKKRLRPVFQNADNLGVKVDFDDVLIRAKAALARYESIPGARTNFAQERASLAGLVDDLEKVSGQGVSAEVALDFISSQKEKLRATTADWKPSKFFETAVTAITKSADEAFTAAAARAGKPEVAMALKSARDQYREMMETVYEDAVKSALKKNPEDVGRLFWQRGNVSEPKQLQRMLALARREGVTNAAESAKLTGAMTRGFLQEAVPNVDTAARWSTILAEKPGLRDTWNTLTSAPGGKELRAAMEVLEEAAKIATRGSTLSGAGIGAVPIRRAEGLGLGVSYVTGTIHPGMLATGLAVLPMTRMMATAYTEGNKGVLNMIARTLRAQSAGTAAAAKAIQAALPALEEFAAEHGITDLFIGERRPEGAASEPEPQ